jgi:hypothetical protein
VGCGGVLSWNAPAMSIIITSTDLADGCALRALATMSPHGAVVMWRLHATRLPMAQRGGCRWHDGWAILAGRHTAGSPGAAALCRHASTSQQGQQPAADAADAVNAAPVERGSSPPQLHMDAGHSAQTSTPSAPAGYNRWLQVPCAAAVSAVCGSNYAWSTFNAPLSRELGVVAAASGDWALTSVLPMFSVATVGLGLGAAVFGKWTERVGPRRAVLAGAAAWGGGLGVAGLGVALHSLPLAYMGYGVLGGVGIGIGYVVPIGVLMRWFPERRGLAAGLGVLGFGGGAALAAPLNEALMRAYRVAPEFISADAAAFTLQGGQRVTTLADGGVAEVVLATAADLEQAGWGA